MNIDYLHQQLELWKRWLFICMGASVSLLATAIADIPNTGSQIARYYHPEVTTGGVGYFPGWFGVWFILQTAVTIPGFLILFAKTWQMLPRSERLNTAFGFFLTAWVTFLALGVRLTLFDTTPGLIYLITLLGAVLFASYFWLKRVYMSRSEELFP